MQGVYVMVEERLGNSRFAAETPNAERRTPNAE